jgi:hypothetical protein
VNGCAAGSTRAPIRFSAHECRASSPATGTALLIPLLSMDRSGFAPADLALRGAGVTGDRIQR